MPDSVSPYDDPAARRGRLIVLVVSGAVLLTLALVVPIPFQQRAASALGDLVHAPLFAFTAWVTLNAWQRIRPPKDLNRRWVWRRSLVVVFGAFLFGAIMELVQGVLGRNAAMHDAISNGLGAVAGAACYASTRSARLLRNPLRLAAPCLILMSWWSPLVELHDVMKVHWDFPVLASFETDVEMTRWYLDDCQIHRDRNGVTHGRYAMRLSFDPTAHPAATLIDLHGDWTDAKSLELDLIVPDEQGPPSIRFVLKVIDHHHRDYHGDVFRKEMTLTRGGTYHVVASKQEMLAGPASRELDLSKIKYVSLQVLDPRQPVVLLVDHLKVSR